ncbi:uncharacterized protein LOC130808092 isoform X1 [Amaranthus tricolor]|uniref:uncharacterized protein LOC130808092 isoform X1 n=1 Tax=Amaranthus tricolor TaxID=29722 RepID=UPI002588E011|nr:uncharacterized protein LOC130808092 isoform X1 [Amaranthus tricolor]
MMTMETQNPLKEAAIRGDVGFLKNCIASNKPHHYYLTLFPISHSEARIHGNIFHLAALENREHFIRVAIELLPFQTKQQLILQQRDEEKSNPLHLAASIGNQNIVKLFLNVFRSSPSSECDGKPWLQKNNLGQTPCHIALTSGHEDCGLEILRMDMELVCNMVDNEGNSLLFAAVAEGFSMFAMEILKFANRFSCSGSDGYTPLHYVTWCSEGEDICRLLLKRDLKLIRQISVDGFSAFHIWAKQGKLWPFERLLKSIDIIPDVRRVFVDLIFITDYEKGLNPLHVLATHTFNEHDAVEIAQLLTDAYKLETKTEGSSISRDDAPWLAHDKEGCTPLSMAIKNGYENLAMYFLLMDHNVLMKCKENALVLAIKKGCHEVVDLILEIVDKHGWRRLLTDDEECNALHLAPLCKRSFKRLLDRQPELLEGVSKDNTTILHSWVEIGELWAFEHVFLCKETDHQCRIDFIKLISACDHNDRNTPLHVAAKTAHEATEQLVKLLVETYKAETPNWVFRRPLSLPWLQQNKDGDGPMHVALRHKREKLALYILSLHNDRHITELLDYYEPVHKTVFLAIEKNCFLVAKEILTKIFQKENWSKYVTDSSDGRTVLHLAANCIGEEFGRWLVNEASVLINQADKNGTTALEVASEVGAASFVKAVLEKDSGVFNSAPLAWVKACAKGHISVIRVFIDYYPGKFSDHCIQHQDSPLHHIQLRNITAYEQFFELPGMKNLINVQDSQGATPLHQAIRNRNILLTETLLNMDKIRYNIKDQENQTARDLLEEACECKEQPEWDHMCRSIGFDPRIKTSYFQHKTNLLDVRNTLSVVAALLATITFTAGFTLPGGFNQENGEAILAKKAAFLIFIISDTVAMCCSMLVLICLIWSMVYDSNKSLFLIDRSMTLLMVALYCTLLTFMTGVYIVISPKSLWAAIFIIVICSLIGISANRTFLYKLLDKFIPSANKEPGDRFRLLEMGKLCRAGNSCLKCN